LDAKRLHDLGKEIGFTFRCPRSAIAATFSEAWPIKCHDAMIFREPVNQTS
jgi:hypothetical protein